MADYKKMYLTLLDEVENAIGELGLLALGDADKIIDRLNSAKLACEEIYIDTSDED